MKKFSLIILGTILTLTALWGCAPDGIPSEIKKNFSEIRVNVYVAESDALKAEITTGQRENPYLVDGTASGMSEYTVITIVPKDTERISQDFNYQYTLSDGKKQYTGVFELHPFGNSYSADIQKMLDISSLELTVTCANEGDDFSDTLSLASVKTDDMIAWQEALMIAIDALDDPLQQMYEGKKLNAEVYVKLLGDPLGKTGDYFWYVAFADGTKITAVLIEPVSKEILAVREH